VVHVDSAPYREAFADAIRAMLNLGASSAGDSGMHLDECLRGMQVSLVASLPCRGTLFGMSDP
jgi:hypothetical protein